MEAVVVPCRNLLPSTFYLSPAHPSYLSGFLIPRPVEDQATAFAAQVRGRRAVITVK